MRTQFLLQWKKRDHVEGVASRCEDIKNNKKIKCVKRAWTLARGQWQAPWDMVINPWVS